MVEPAWISTNKSALPKKLAIPYHVHDLLFKHKNFFDKGSSGGTAASGNTIDEAAQPYVSADIRLSLVINENI